MKLSVVIPNYNNEIYLQQAIESALAILPDSQAEVVLVDDCSTDDSYRIAREYEGSIRIYQNEKNLGQELTTNKALSLASGEYAVLLHSDDILHPNFYEDLVVLLERNPSAVMAVGERDEIDSDGRVIYQPAPFYDSDYFIPGIEQAKVFLVTAYVPCQVLFKRDVVMSFGGAQRFCEVNLDGLLWFKTALNGDVVYTQKRVCSYRKHTSSTTSSLNQSMIHPFEYYCTLKAMFNYAEEKGIDIRDQFPRTFERVAELAIRFAKEGYAHNHDTSLCKRYLLLAQAINPLITHAQSFIDLEKQINSAIPLVSGISVRTNSYAPPVGSKEIRS